MRVDRYQSRRRSALLRFSSSFREEQHPVLPTTVVVLLPQVTSDKLIYSKSNSNLGAKRYGCF